MKRSLYLLALLILIIVLENCAKIGSPAGGPKDITPPQIEKSTPENNSVNFNNNKIVIDFDEYVQLKEINKYFIVSPPFREKPEVRIKGKSLLIDILDDLRENTTYNYNLGDAIVDVNENNPIKNFHYVFSTGSYIDSLSISGYVVNAFTLQPEQTVLVMLYRTDEDSVLINDTALYVAKTKEDGRFVINNISYGEYYVYAIKDANNNYLFDQAEPVAFPDSSVMAIMPGITDTDTLQTDSVQIEDSIVADFDKCKLYLFEEGIKTQYLKEFKREQRYKCTFFFNRPLKDSMYVRPINFTKTGVWNIMEYNSSGDSITCWLTDTTAINMDTLSFLINYKKKDSLDRYISFTDTVKLISKKDTKKKNKDEPEEITYMGLSANVKNGQVFDLNKNISVICSAPVSKIDTNRIRLIYISDSAEISRKYELIKDSLHLRKYKILTSFEENSKYKLQILPKAFTDIYDQDNDTLFIDFSTQKSDHYGNIILTLSGVKTQVIIQLLNGKEDIIREYFAESDKVLKLDYLSPVVAYKLKFIIDANFNKKWDTGNYLKKIQPEKVSYFPGEIRVRSNWDVELDWEFKD